jgi:SAM-dependent methyltransferase
MIGKRDEYERMFEAERDLWWYRILHQKVVSQIKNHFDKRLDISILDAGCGTGGNLFFLKKNGYPRIEGFDFSTDGVAFSQSRGLMVVHHDLTKIAEYKPEKKFDVIICNDVFTYFTDEVITDVMRQIRQKLNPNGIFITNNNAHPAFAGIHDVVVGGQKRFVKTDLHRFAMAAGFKVVVANYWSFLLSPLVYAVRAWQRFLIKRGKVDYENTHSDVSVPPVIVNQPLYFLVKLEEKLVTNAPIGSSLFTVME